MLGTVGFEELRVQCLVGVYPHERVSEQTLIIDLKVEGDLSGCIKSDSLHDALDYAKLVDLCKKVANENRFHLIEAYAHAILEEVLAQFSASTAWIKIRKPGALPEAKCAFVELERCRFLSETTSVDRKPAGNQSSILSDSLLEIQNR